MKLVHVSGVFAALGAGPGLTRGFGTPDVRIAGSIGWSTARKRNAEEPEEQGSLPKESASEETALQETAAPDEEEGDRDLDGQPDSADGCPDEAEDRDGYDDEDGCPDNDNDADGMPDHSDACPMDAGSVETDGCPEPDSDGDHISGGFDSCPEEAGTVENHGCKEAPKVVIGRGRIQILGRIQFRTEKVVPRRDSHDLLMQIARVINEHPELKRIRVEGHTDDRGNPKRNQRLSRWRAEAVVHFLITQGKVDPTRLVARGVGFDRPIVSEPKSDEDYAKNRRVEFHIEVEEATSSAFALAEAPDEGGAQGERAEMIEEPPAFVSPVNGKGPEDRGNPVGAESPVDVRIPARVEGPTRPETGERKRSSEG